MKKLMIVDDSASMRLVIFNFFKSNPDFVVVAAASNGKEALVKLDEVKPDLILLDIEMPEMDGLEFLRHVRLKSDAKVVVLSSVTQAGSPQAQMARSLGADAVVAKPSGSVSYDLQEKSCTELWKVINQVLGIK